MIVVGSSVTVTLAPGQGRGRVDLDRHVETGDVHRLVLADLLVRLQGEKQRGWGGGGGGGGGKKKRKAAVKKKKKKGRGGGLGGWGGVGVGGRRTLLPRDMHSSDWCSSPLKRLYKAYP